MNIDEFKKEGYQLIDWIAKYYEEIEDYPVKSQVKPNEIYDQLPGSAPEFPVPFGEIMHDVDDIIMKGITHWQHPGYFAYFNANTSFPSILGELLTSAIGAQCMIWDTSPSAAELEQKVCEWIRDASGLPQEWHGVIQDTASTATLCALLMAREKHSNFRVNEEGFTGTEKYVIYCSSEAHSSVEKGAKIAGFGKQNIRKIAVDEDFAMVPEKLEEQIRADKTEGYAPLCVVSAVGTTGSHAIDPIKEIGEVCKNHHVFHHVDAAHAGNAAILPEFQWIIDGIDMADTYTFNPHKWMFTNFDCSLLYTNDKDSLIRTFEILPEYLKTSVGKTVHDYRDWGIQLGRRFRALKLWFVLRSYGLSGIQEKFRTHIQLAKGFADRLEADGRFQLLAPAHLNLVCFRFFREKAAQEELNQLNEAILTNLNASGKVYLTHTKLNGMYTIRVCIGQTNVEKRHVEMLLSLLIEQVEKLD